jgi:uncharacterized protein YcfJ
MKSIVLPTALVALLGTYAGLAAAQQGYGDVAKVTGATPITERVTQDRRECRVEQVNGYTERREATGSSAPSGAGAVVGAIIGGVIGHQFGGSSAGRDHGTAAGAIVGGLVGNQVEKENGAGGPPETLVERTPVTRDVERCRYVPETRDRVVAYDVTYEYNGHAFRTRLPYDPGPEMPVNVDVRPPAPARAAYNGPTAAPSYRY